MIHIDGSQGEGGGQILRSALALSMALGRAFTISNIRANREKPGLMRQHVTAVEAAVAICGAKVSGASAGSRELVFDPGVVRAGAHTFQVGTAGSTTLVLQAIMPALLVADATSELTIEGGTHAKAAPPYEFLERSLAPILNRLGAKVSLTLERHGFYPAGGGRITARVEPVRVPLPIVLDERGEITSRRATAVVSKLSGSIAAREIKRLRDRLNWEQDQCHIVEIVDAACPGNVLWIELKASGVTSVFSSIGEQGKSAELVADDAVQEVRAYLASGVPVNRHLADQLMVPLAIASARGAGSCSFRTMPLSRHATTNTSIVEAFFPGSVRVAPSADGATWSVTV